MRQIEPVRFLPPSKEVLLEIQVSSFIKDFLFSGADDCKTGPSSSPSRVDQTIPGKPQLVLQPSTLEEYGSFGQKENNPTSVPSESPSKSASGLGRSGGGQFSDGSTSSGETSIKVDDHWEKGTELRTQTVTSNTSWIQPGKWIEKALGKATKGSEDGANPVISDYQAIAMEAGEGKTINSSQISRAETFPCKSKTQRERQFIRTDSNGTYDAGTEIKHSCRKPPRPPPRLTRQPSDRKDCPRLPRCASDTNLLLQSCRKTKTERRRKMTAASSTSSATPFWALIFTLCFAVAMILQGVSSQGSRTLAMKSTNASSPAGSNTSRSVKMNFPASLPKGSPYGNSVFESSNWLKEADADDLQREGTRYVWPILKGFEFHSSGASIS